MAVEMTDRMKARMEPSRIWLKEAEGNTDEQAIETLRESKEAVIAVMRKLSEEQSQFSSSEGEWCARQVGLHLTQTNRNIAALMPALAAGVKVDAKGKPGYVPDGPDVFTAVCDELESSFDLLSGSFKSISGKDPELGSTYDHPYFGTFSARQWFIFCPLHVNIHIEQLQRITESDGFPAN